MLKSFFVLASLLMLTNAQAGELYRSIDKDGKVHYSDAPLEGSEDFEQLKLPKEPVPSADIPYETQRAMQNFPVTLYAFPTCGPVCQQARDFLNKRGIPFTEKSLVSKEDIEAFHRESGDSQFPTLAVGKSWLKGFHERSWNNELDFAGYPKKMFAYRPSIPASAPSQPAQ